MLQIILQHKSRSATTTPIFNTSTTREAFKSGTVKKLCWWWCIWLREKIPPNREWGRETKLTLYEAIQLSDWVNLNGYFVFTRVRSYVFSCLYNSPANRSTKLTTTTTTTSTGDQPTVREIGRMDGWMDEWGNRFWWWLLLNGDDRTSVVVVYK